MINRMIFFSVQEVPLFFLLPSASRPFLYDTKKPSFLLLFGFILGKMVYAWFSR